MVYNKIIEGEYVRLRSITIEDAEFSLEIRQDPIRNRFLHHVDNDLEKQKRWIEDQRSREGDYFFIVETKKGKMIGTVGIYDIKGDTGTLGRLLFIGNPYATFEGTMLAAEFGYEVLGLDKLTGDVDENNQASLNISEAIGFKFQESVYDEDMNRYVKYGIGYRSEFGKYKNQIKKMIYR